MCYCLHLPIAYNILYLRLQLPAPQATIFCTLGYNTLHLRLQHLVPEAISTSSVYIYLDEPFKVDIANSNLVTLEGPGLEQAKINQPANFTVDVSSAGVGDVTVHITGEWQWQRLLKTVVWCQVSFLVWQIYTDCYWELLVLAKKDICC